MSASARRSGHGPVQEPWALVTGASSGIGAAYARTLAGQGVSVGLVARRGDRLEALGDELSERFGVGSDPLALDLSTEAGIGEAERWIAHRGGLTALVHSAGFGTRAHFADLPPERTLQMLRLHVEAGVRLTRAVLPAMLSARSGDIVLVSSLAGFFTTARYVTYSATKAYLNQFAEGLRAEVAADGLRVQALCPGLTRTGFLDTPDYAEFKYEQVPSWAWLTPEQVVRASQAALARGGPTVVIPGRMNRLLVGSLRAPGLGAALRWGLGRLSAGGLY